MTSINFVREIQRRKSRISEGERGDSEGGGGFLSKLRNLGGEGLGLQLDSREKTLLVLAFVGIASIFGGRIYVSDYLIPPLERELNDRIAGLESQITAEKQKIAQFDSIRAEIASYDQQMADLQTKLQLIESVQKNRNSIVRMVDFVITEMPENVWLMDVTVDLTTRTSGLGKVDVAGKALSMQLVSEFMKRLEGAVFFPRWELSETTSASETSGTGSNVKQYESKNFKVSAEVLSL